PRDRRAPERLRRAGHQAHDRPLRLRSSSVTISRREFIRTAGAAGALVASGAWRYGAKGAVGTAGAHRPPPAPEQSGIEHIVVVMMENRSFDHFLGWMPGADGKQAGLTYLDGKGTPHQTHHLDGEY